MKVRAKEITGMKYSGYYNHKRRFAGEIFTLVPITKVKDGKKIIIAPEHQFSDKWMEKVDEKTVQQTETVTVTQTNVVNPDDDVI